MKTLKKNVHIDGDFLYDLDGLPAILLIEAIMELSEFGDIKITREYIPEQLGERIIISSVNEDKTEHKYIPFFIQDFDHIRHKELGQLKIEEYETNK